MLWILVDQNRRGIQSPAVTKRDSTEFECSPPNIAKSYDPENSYPPKPCNFTFKAGLLK